VTLDVLDDDVAIVDLVDDIDVGVGDPALDRVSFESFSGNLPGFSDVDFGGVGVRP